MLLEVTASLHFDSTVSLGNWDRKPRHAFGYDYLYIIAICINRDFFSALIPWVSILVRYFLSGKIACVTNFLLQKDVVDFNILTSADYKIWFNYNNSCSQERKTFLLVPVTAGCFFIQSNKNVNTDENCQSPKGRCPHPVPFALSVLGTSHGPQLSSYCRCCDPTLGIDPAW